MTMPPLHRYTLPIAIMLAASACGGGSSSNSSDNTAPRASGGSIDAGINAPTTGQLTATDAENNTLTYTLEQAPSNGTISGLPNTTGSFTYTPDSGSSIGSSDAFTFKANDGDLDSNIAQITLNLTNTPPVAEDSNLQIKTSLSMFSGQAAATDPDGDPLTFQLLSIPSGSLQFEDDGSFVYTVPSSAVAGETTSFTFRASDEENTSNTATVDIEFVPPLTAVDDSVAISEDDTVEIAVLSNDLNALNETVTIEITAQGSGGVATINPDNTIRYAHTGESDSDSFTYRLVSSSETSPSATVNLSITTFDDLPSIAGTCLQHSINVSNTSGNISDLLNDPDGGNTFVIDSQGTLGTVAITNAQTGEFTYTPNNNRQGYMDSFDFTVTSEDSTELSGTYDLIYGPARIMPLGDSITVGRITAAIVPTTGDVHVSYRLKLRNDLIADGYDIFFVGQEENGQAGGLSNDNHEGHGGEDMAFINSEVAGFLDANPADVILLHIGTNDGTSVRPGAPDHNEIDTILTTINSWASQAGNNRVAVLVAEIIDQVAATPDLQFDEDTFNAGIVALINASWLNDNTDSIDVPAAVNMHDALNYPADMSPTTGGLADNGLHPTQDGYDKMADKWRTDLIASGAIVKCP
ncbi:MAG: Ig-like domain-containing protein [Pseudomonadota bacterium]